MKILIAEDDPICRRILEANLLEWGYDVMVASDGGEAWEIIQQPESPNFIISDWMMPQMDWRFAGKFAMWRNPNISILSS